MDIYEKLYEAVKEHSGLDNDQLAEVAEHSADAGWAGFTYYKDTAVKKAARFREDDDDQAPDV